MVKLCPSPSSIVVVTLRVFSPGTIVLPIVAAIDRSRMLASGVTTRLMRPFSSTVGVKARLMPNSLNSTDCSVPPSPTDATVGMGNSPPARKLAVSPESAMRFGSARVLTSPFVSKASKKSEKLDLSNELLKNGMPVSSAGSLSASAAAAPASEVTVVTPPTTAVVAVDPRSVSTWAPVRKVKSPMPAPGPGVEKVCSPNAFDALREISVKRTASITCWEPFRLSMLTTCFGANRSAIASTWEIFSPFDTVPVRTTELPTARTPIFSFGRSSNSRCFNPSTS